jgi:hypothetical protein
LDGADLSPPVLGPNGELYGTTIRLGPNIGGYEAIYELTPPASPGGNWTDVGLYYFHEDKHGSDPVAVTLGSDGNLYGTTRFGGKSKDGVHGQGTTFQLVLQ